MYNFLTKHGQTAALLFGLLVIVIFMIAAFTGLSGLGYDLGTDLNALDKEQKLAINSFDIGLWLTVIMTVVAGVLAIIVFGIWDLIKFPKSAMKFGIGFLGLIILVGILYATASPETAGTLGKIHQKFDISDNVSKVISAGLWTVIGLVGVAALVMVVAEIRNLFK